MKVVIHVGYPKCASTSLQANLFERCPDLNFVAGTGKGGVMDVLRREDEARAEEAWQNAARLLSDRSTNVLSHEELISRSFSPPDMAARLARLCPQAHILAFVRPQREIIRSLYDMHPVTTWADRDSGRVTSVEAWADCFFRDEIEFARPAEFLFGDHLNRLRQLFGEDKIHVFTVRSVFEDGSHVPRLADTLGISRTEIETALSMPRENDFARHAARRRIRQVMGPVHGSWFLPRSVLRAVGARLGSRMTPTRTRLPADLITRIEAYYAADTARLRAIAPNLGPLR